MLTKDQIAQRIAKEVKTGQYINLGIGIPTLVANYIPSNLDVDCLESAPSLRKIKSILISSMLVSKPLP